MADDFWLTILFLLGFWFFLIFPILGASPYG